MLKELVDILTCRELEPEQLLALTASIEEAVADPQSDWTDDSSPDQLPMTAWMEDPSPDEVMLAALHFKLYEHFAIGDKIDEVHELISDFFAEPLPDFPYREGGPKLLVSEYFAWLDPLLAERGNDDGGYELLLLDDTCTDNLNAILVWRSDTPRALEIATELAFRLEQSTRAYA
jgi:hypothetical protein